MLEQQSLQAISEQYVNNIEDKANKIQSERSSVDVEPFKIEIEKLKAQNKVLVEEIKSLNSRPEPDSGVNPAEVEKQIEDALKAQE